MIVVEGHYDKIQIYEKKRFIFREEGSGIMYIPPESNIDLYAIFEQEDIDNILHSIDQIQGKRGKKSYFAILCATGEMDKLLHRYELEDLHIQKLGKSQGTWLFESEMLNPETSEPMPLKWILIRHKQTNIYKMFAFEKSAVFHNHVMHQIMRYYPILSYIFFSTQNMKQILNEASSFHGAGEIYITQLTRKGKIEDKNSGKILESHRTWTSRPFKDAFMELQEQGQWATSIQFEVCIKSNFVRGNIWRYGVLRCDESVQVFHDTVIKVACDEAIKIQRFYQNRGQTDNPDNKAKPLVIQYDTQLFRDNEQRERFISTLESHTNSSLSMFHNNPYIHAVMVDYLDGSAYDIWVLADDHVTIVPKQRATLASLQRLCNHICDNFYDGDIKDYTEIVLEDTTE